MYLDHFGLTQYPFSCAPDPRFFYPSPAHEEALSCLIYAVEEHGCTALITGEVGTGKTMLCYAALERFGSDVCAALVTYNLLSPEEFYRQVCEAFGLSQTGTKRELRKTLLGFLMEQKARGRKAALIIDEAQNLSLELLEEVRNLSNIETPTEKLLQIILLGQPELRQLIAKPRLRALDQRIVLKFHLDGLSEEQVGAYVDHRLGLAGSEGREIFDAGAKRELFLATGGVPRLINILCDQALLAAYVDERGGVDAETVRSVVSEREGYFGECEGGASSQAPPSAPGPAGHMAAEGQGIMGPRDVRLIVRRDGAAWGALVVREGTELTVGRDSELCGLALLDRAISRTHAVISNKNGRPLIEDANSTNGTWVNCSRVVSAPLGNGDVVQIGRCALLVRARAAQ